MAEASLFVHNLDSEIYDSHTSEMQSHINIGTGEDITIKELAQKVKESIGFNGKLTFDENKPDGSPRKLLSINLLKSLGWEPRMNLEEGLKISYLDFQNRH